MALFATPQTISALASPRLVQAYPRMESTGYYCENVNSAWTHPNPYVEQVGNHLFHKDELPSNLKFNDQRRDKEVIDDLRNRGLRYYLGDKTPSFARHAVQRPPDARPLTYITGDTVMSTVTTASPLAAAAVYSSNVLPETTFRSQLGGKPYSPLAPPFYGHGATLSMPAGVPAKPGMTPVFPPVISATVTQPPVTTVAPLTTFSPAPLTFRGISSPLAYDAYPYPTILPSAPVTTYSAPISSYSYPAAPAVPSAEFAAIFGVSPLISTFPYALSSLPAMVTPFQAANIVGPTTVSEGSAGPPPPPESLEPSTPPEVVDFSQTPSS